MNKPRIKVEQRPGGLHFLHFPATQGPEWMWFVIWGSHSTLEGMDRSMQDCPDMRRDWKIATGRA